MRSDQVAGTLEGVGLGASAVGIYALATGRARDAICWALGAIAAMLVRHQLPALRAWRASRQSERELRRWLARHDAARIRARAHFQLYALARRVEHAMRARDWEGW